MLEGVRSYIQTVPTRLNDDEFQNFSPLVQFVDYLVAVNMYIILLLRSLFD